MVERPEQVAEELKLVAEELELIAGELKLIVEKLTLIARELKLMYCWRDETYYSRAEHSGTQVPSLYQKGRKFIINMTGYDALNVSNLLAKMSRFGHKYCAQKPTGKATLA